MEKIKCKVVNDNGVLAIQINDKKYAPVAFKSFRPVERNISDFYQAGVRLFNILSTGTKSASGILKYSLYGESWLDDETYDFTAIDNQIDFFIANAPEAYFCLMICLDTREWWLKKYADYPNSFWKLAQMEADPYWREMAAKYMEAVLRHVEEKYGDKMFGYVLMAGTTTEWLSDQSYEEGTPTVLKAYRRWKQDDNAVIPDKEKLEAINENVFLDCEREGDVIDYRKFASWQRADTILYFASKAQEILKHNKLLGVYYGYIFELGNKRLYDAGHLGYEDIFTSEDIDIIAQPYGYEFRGQECGSQQMVTNASLALRNKITFLEHDQTTCLVPERIEGGVKFAHPNKAETIEEDVNLLRRDFMFAITNNCALWWFDMFGGWFYDDVLMREIGNQVSIYEQLTEMGYASVSEVAVIVDPDSLHYLNKNSRLNNLLLYYQRNGLSFMGAPYDMYSACDVNQIDLDKYKLIFFADQFKKKDATETFIAEAKKRGKTLLFAYAYNVVDATFCLSHMSESLGMQIVENPNQEKCIEMNKEYLFDCGSAKRCFAIEDESVEELGRYQNSKKVAMGYKKEGNATIVFSGLGNLNGDVLKEILSLAGVHSYTTDTKSIAYVNSKVLGVYHSYQEDTTITLREDAEYIDVFNKNKKYVSKDKQLEIPYDGVRAKLLIKQSIQRVKSRCD